MVKKNIFLIFNNVVCELYRCRTYADLGEYFLPILRMLIPFRYASIMRREADESRIRLVDPLCVPAEFEEAERNYMRYADDDYTAWLNCCRESTIFRESDLLGEQQRLRSTIYQKCYQKFDVYDSLQYGIVHNGKPLGALSLFCSRGDGPFTDDELAELAFGIDQMRCSILTHQKAEEQIRSANSQLVTAMSHDLRTPLTTLQIYTDILRLQKYEPDQLADYLNKIDAKAAQIKQLADNIFTYSLATKKQYVEHNIKSDSK